MQLMRSKFLFLTFLIFISSLYAQATYIKKELNTDTPDTEEQSRPPEVRKYTIESPQQIIIPNQQQNSREAQLLREEVSNLKKELQDQKELIRTQGDATIMLLERNLDLTNTQSKTISDLIMDTTVILQSFSTFTMTYIDLQGKYKDAFIFNPNGKPYAYIDFPELKIYEYNSGDLLGWINADKNEVIRNYDGSTIATIENDFLIDDKGAPIGSIERSETLRWEREKLLGMLLKTPLSHFFVQSAVPQQFIQPKYRTSDWSTQKIEDVLFFSEKNIQKLK